MFLIFVSPAEDIVRLACLLRGIGALLGGEGGILGAVFGRGGFGWVPGLVVGCVEGGLRGRIRVKVGHVAWRIAVCSW